MRFVRPVASFIGVLILFVVLGSAASTHFVLQGLTDLGVAISLSERISMTLQDIIGIGPLYGGIFGTGLLVAFIVAMFVARLAPSLRWLVYLVAGATAVTVTLFALQAAFGIVAISGTRSTAGFLTQVAIGAFIGYVFARLTSRKTG